MNQLIAALNLAFPPNVTTFPFPPGGTVSISQFSIQADGTVNLANPTPDRLALLQEVIAANPIT